MAAPIGLDIGSSAIRATQIRQGRNGTSLERLAQMPLPAGAVRDGEIVDADVVVDALKELWRSAKLKGRKVSVGLANQQVVVRRLDLPYMTESELRASLPLQVDGLIPIPVHEAVLDFCYLGEHTGDDGERMVRILVVAALRTMVDELLAVVRQAKLDPVGIDLDAFAALRSLTPPDVLADPVAELLVDVGATVTDMVVHQGGSPHFVRTVLFGGQRMTALLSERIGVDLDEAERLKLELARTGSVSGTGQRVGTGPDADAGAAIEPSAPPTYEGGPRTADGDDRWSSDASNEAGSAANEPQGHGAWSYGGPEDRRPSDEPTGAGAAPGRGDQRGGGGRARPAPDDGLSGSEVREPRQIPSDGDAHAASGDPSDTRDDAAEIVREETRRLIDEIKGSLDYCATQEDIPSIGRVVLTGGASQWPELGEAMAMELGLDITTGSPLHLVGNGKGSGLGDEELAATEPHLAVAVGLALGALQ